MCIKIRQDNYEVRKHILLHLLTYTGNQNAGNIPEGVRDYLQCYISLTIKKTMNCCLFFLCLGEVNSIVLVSLFQRN
jgi:hypothetical protein